jgi:hypothetical protein
MSMCSKRGNLRVKTRLRGTEDTIKSFRIWLEKFVDQDEAKSQYGVGRHPFEPGDEVLCLALRPNPIFEKLSNLPENAGLGYAGKMERFEKKARNYNEEV